MSRILRACTITLTTALITTLPVLSADISAPALSSPSEAHAAQPTRQAREMPGEFVKRGSGNHRADATRAEDDTAYPPAPFSVLPVLDDELAGDIANRAADESVRVIVYLDFLPHQQVAANVRERHAAEYRHLRDSIKSINATASKRRDPKSQIDGLDYGATRLSDEERSQMRALALEHEALDLTVKRQILEEISPLVKGSQQPVSAAIERLGGQVEFGTIAGNVVVARMPAGKIAALARVDGILRVTGDVLAQSHLNVADGATLTNAPGGLWSNGYCGGIWDAGVIDSGLDLNHPAMNNDASRTNFYSWYLVAGVGSPNWDDIIGIDDQQGHGTHVSGIVGSEGSTGFTSHLGMAYCVEKLVTLKAGWKNSSTGGASMFWSDKYNIVDRVLYDTNNLQPFGTFADDIETLNLSYGGSTSLDDTDAGRFWDSAVVTFPDLFATISAGNSGPNNTLFSDPAVSYNVMTVANAQDNGTEDRSNDTIRSSSTVGPTANGRRKPDIAAHGTSITAPNHAWEGAGSDMVAKTGTSMAAPMVLGIATDLMDAGVFDGLEVKALLINTAQKNLPNMNIESDSDGWDDQIGWGLINALAAYQHRADVNLYTVEPRDLDGSSDADYRLFMGTMQDEGASGEGRDKATMVWHRSAVYNTAAPPTTFYTNVDLNLRLYNETNNFLFDTDLDGDDNVHQVRVSAGTPITSVVVKPYSWSTSFSHGGATQQFALALEEGFTEVTLPQPLPDMQGIAFWPTSIEPNEVFEIEFWMRNDATTIGAHNNTFELLLPVGFTRLSGPAGQTNAGTAAANGGTTNHVTWSIRAPNSAVGAQTIRVAHFHQSYAETSNTINWNMGTTVEIDNTPPNPNPMCFTTAPFNASTTSISMTACLASDAAHNPVEYYLQWTSTPSGGPGFSDSGWQSSRSFTDTFLGTNHEYCYRAWARDSSSSPTLTSPSASECTYTSQSTPAGISFGSVTTTSIDAFSSSTPPNLTLGSSGLLIRNTTAGTDSGWKQNNSAWTSGGLTPAAGYSFNAQARNGDGDTTPNSPSAVRYTLANFPAVDSLLTESDTSIKVVINPNGNSNQAEYLIENTTAGTNSGWINDTSWSSGGLTCETFYNFQARARNGDGIETIIVPLGLQTTGTCSVDTDGDGIDDSTDNCTNVFNPGQEDANGDNIGNICDADVTGPGPADDDCVVNFPDLQAFKDGFFGVDPELNLDGLGNVNFADLTIVKSQFFGPPGPSALGCN